MLDFTEIKIEDKGLFDSYLKTYNPQISELTFTNLFMWRNYYKIKFTEINGLLCIISTPEAGSPYAFMPIGNLTAEAFAEAASYLKQYFSEKGWCLEFKRVASHQLSLFDNFNNKETNLDNANSDYVYLTENMVNLKGKKYDGKRNHINRFKKEHEFEYVPMSSIYIDECYRIMDEWCAERSCDEHKVLYCEKLANTELLRNFDRLKCRGALIKVDDRFEAFTVGEMLNNDTAVIHIEKAKSSINGLYTITNQQFCANEWQGTIYINREQDLGIEGIKKAKLSYNPVKMIEKYSICVK